MPMASLIRYFVKTAVLHVRKFQMRVFNIVYVKSLACEKEAFHTFSSPDRLTTMDRVINY